MYTIAHLSDLHLTSDPKARRLEPTLGRLVGMNAACKYVLNSIEVRQCNLILVTGDVTDRGHIAAWRILDHLLIETGLKSRASIVPGNHDICGLSVLRVGLPNFTEADLKNVRAGLAIVSQPLRFPWAKVVDPRVVVFGLDTNNSGNWSVASNAVGRIGNRQLSRLAELLAKHKDVPVKIVMMHHSPNIPEPQTALRRGRTPMSLLDRWAHEIPKHDRRALRYLCVSHRVRLVLHGHLHAAEDRRVNGVRIIGAPATTQPIQRNTTNPQYQFYKYTVLGKGGRVIRELKVI